MSALHLDSLGPVQIATWNIRAGGGRRIGQIAQTIIDESPDILVLTEFRHAPGRELLELLKPLSFHVAAGSSTGAQNCVCVLSRFPIQVRETKMTPKNVHRWISAFIPDLDLTLLGVHVPNQTEIWNKREFLDCIEVFANEASRKRYLILGDLNTALDEDCEGEKIREAVYLQRLLDAGWVDAWRKHNLGAREFSWYSHRRNGFRLDHCLASPALADSIIGSSMRHDVRTNRLSDHSMLTVDLGCSLKQLHLP